MELAASAGVVLSVLLIGHPKLRNDLRRPQMVEIGYRTSTFEFEGVSGSRREFINWLLKACAQDGVKLTDMMDADAIELLAERLRTALQIEMHLTLAFQQAFRLGEKRVSAEIVEQVLSRATDDLEGTSKNRLFCSRGLIARLRLPGMRRPAVQCRANYTPLLFKLGAIGAETRIGCSASRGCGPRPLNEGEAVHVVRQVAQPDLRLRPDDPDRAHDLSAHRGDRMAEHVLHPRAGLRCGLVRSSSRCNRGNTPGSAPRSGGSESAPDVYIERLDQDVPRHLEPVAQEVPQRDAELVAGLGQPQERISAVAAGIAARPGADLAPGDVATDIVLRPVGVQRRLWPVQHRQQLGFVGVQALQQPVQRDEAGAAQEDAVELLA
jgi:hypothetical protein